MHSPNWVSSHRSQPGLGPWWEVNQLFQCFLPPSPSVLPRRGPSTSPRHPDGVTSTPASGPCPVPLQIQPWLQPGRSPLRTRCLLGCLPACCRSKAAVSIKWRKDGPNSCGAGFLVCLLQENLSSSSSSCISMWLVGDGGPVGSAGGGAAAALEGGLGRQPAGRVSDPGEQMRFPRSVCSRALCSCRGRCVPLSSHPHPGQRGMSPGPLLRDPG